MYTNIYYDRDKNRIHLWDDKLGYKSFPYKKYAYIKDKDGKYLTIFGEKVAKIHRWTKDMEDDMFESDVYPEMRTLIDLYYDSEDDDYPENRIAVIDIEVETTQGLPNIELADKKITGITIHDSETDKYYAFILDPSLTVDETQLNLKDNTVVRINLSESELLEEFLDTYVQLKPTIISGWNVDFFDMPYLIRRIAQVLGQHRVKELSPVGILRFSDWKNRFIIAGVNVLDYLALYKKFNFSEEPSYRLDSIAKKELGKGKTEFEGTIQQLYENDIEKFIEYNINDVELVVELDKKKKFFDLAVGISHKGRTPYEDIFYSSKYLEGAILCDLKRNNMVAPNKPARTLDNKTFIGAYVKDPKPGFYEWVFDLDLTSLYPSIIMSLNISPETKMGKILDWDEGQFSNRIDRTWRLQNLVTNQIVNPTTEELLNFLKSTKYHISSNGIIYASPSVITGVIPKILSKWFEERVKYKNLMKKYGKADNAEQYDFYDKLQTIQKVLLNSLYGVLGLPIFRFYDLDNAAAVTTTGQAIIKYSEVKGNEFYFNTLGEKKDYCIYIDTDSLFFSATPLADKLFPGVDKSDIKLFTTKTIEIVSKVQKYINDSYDEFAQNTLHIQGKHRFEIKQELICLSGIWTAKKRYALQVINREGIFIDKLDVKGLDIVRSSFPPAFKGFMTNILISILKKVPQVEIDKSILDLEDSINSIPLLDISKNTSINNIVKYQSTDTHSEYYEDGIFSVIKKGTPAHVKAAIAFNDLLKYFQLEDKISPIGNGEKIKWCYLKKNNFGLDKIAYRGYDDPQEIIDFVELYIDKYAIYDAELKTKLQNIYDALNWLFPNKMKFLGHQFFN